ncbi:MAG: YifB family Mg chelatase-like AAA ATPase [Tissierellia bacterium]|nr:YifB family Mg chelatase-like AAA ATPase [Tissierellia bacterium]
MYAKVNTCSLQGLDGHLVEVETDLTQGLPKLTIVGLPDAAIREAGERVRSAIKNSAFEYPMSRITINLSPANLKKDGSQMDLAIAMSILMASGHIKAQNLDQWVFLGELQLNGKIGPIIGALPMVISLREAGIKGCLVPKANEKECAVVADMEIFAVDSLKEVVEFLNQERDLPRSYVENPLEDRRQDSLDFADIRGQDQVKRAMEIAAAGAHNLLMIGPPGSGKSMSAKRLPSILPALSFEEAIEVTKIYSVAGLLEDKKLMTRRPFRAPHHTASSVALIGGGAIPKPGEISLSHQGVLFLDELPEFQSKVLEVLRQPMEDGTIHISRANASLTYPSNFQLVAAMNPCPCGNYKNPHQACTCSMSAINRYLSKISHPLLDRMDLHVEVSPVDYKDLSGKEKGESSASIRQRVEVARDRQKARYKGEAFSCNAHLPDRLIPVHCQLKPSSQKILELAFKKYKFSGRTYNKLLKLARTIADLAQRETIEDQDLLEALQFRSLESKYWG